MLPTLDIDLLRTFVTLVETGNFTRTGERLGRTQSAISVQMRRLEDQAGARLLDRGGGAVMPTEAGEQLLTYARRILALNDEAVGRLRTPPVGGTVRLGTPEEFAAKFLADILAAFARIFPHVSLDITVDTSAVLRAGVAEGAFDLALAKRVPGEGPGRAVWREPLLWVARADWQDDPNQSVPIIASRVPCLYRRFMIEALQHLGRSWEIRCTSAANSALQAAVLAGLGVSALARSTVSPGMRVLSPAEGFPALPDSEIALLTSPGELSPAARRLTEFILDRLAVPADPE